MQKLNRTDKQKIESFCETALKFNKSANFFGGPEALFGYADCGKLYMSESFAGVFLLFDAGGFFRLYFAVTDKEAALPDDLLGASLPVVSEIAYRGAEPPPVLDCFFRCGFFSSLNRFRMSFQTGDFLKKEMAKAATGDLCEEIFNLFCASFDRYTGCLPTLSELQKAAEEGRIVAACRNGELCGALLYENSGVVSTLCNLAVAQNMRSQGFGSSLVLQWREKMAAENRPVLRLWVAQNNKGAIALYEKHDFKPDGMKSAVLIKN